MPPTVNAAGQFVELFVTATRAYAPPTGSVNPDPSSFGVVVDSPMYQVVGEPEPNRPSRTVRSSSSLAPMALPPYLAIR
jgi:hypothetical protein